MYKSKNPTKKLASNKNPKSSQNFKEIKNFFEKDPKLFSDFTTFLDTKVNTQELSRHGGPLSYVSHFISSYTGYYNPDVISIDTYNKLRMNPQIAAGLKVIKLPIIGQQWTTVCDDKDIGEFIDQLLRPLWYNLLTSILTSVDYGFSANEIVYDIQEVSLTRKRNPVPFFEGKAVVWKKFKSLYPDTVKVKLDEMENFDGIVQKWFGQDIILPVEKSFIFTHDKGDSFGNLFGNSRLKPVYDVWYWWINLISFMMRYYERKGTPPVIVKFPLGQTKDGVDHADVALDIGKALLGESVVAIPSNVYDNTPEKWKIEYLLDDKRGEMFLSALTFFENKMLRGMFVPERIITQDSSSKAGSYALSQVHEDMFLLGEEALLVDIENQINKYVIRRLVEYNFGAKSPHCFIKIERITDERQAFLKDIFRQMVKSGTAIPAAREIADFVGVPLIDEELPSNAMYTTETGPDGETITSGAKNTGTGAPPNTPSNASTKTDTQDILTYTGSLTNPKSASNPTYPDNSSNADLTGPVNKRDINNAANNINMNRLTAVSSNQMMPGFPTRTDPANPNNINNPGNPNNIHNPNNPLNINSPKNPMNPSNIKSPYNPLSPEYAKMRKRHSEDVEDSILLAETLSSIKTKMDSIEKTYLDTLVNDVLEKQKNMVLNKIMDLLTREGSIEDVWYIKIKDINDLETVTLWRPLNVKMLNIVTSLMKDAYLFGQASGLKELKSNNKAVMDKVGSAFIDNRARMIVDNYFNNMKYITELSVLSASSENKTEEDIVNDIKKQFETIKNKDLPNIVSSEGMLFLNSGRRKVAKENT